MRKRRTSARVMPSPCVATSLDVIPPLDTRNLGLSVNPDTHATKAVPTRSPKTRPPAPSACRGTPLLVYRITSRPRESWTLTCQPRYKRHEPHTGVQDPWTDGIPYSFGGKWLFNLTVIVVIFWVRAGGRAAAAVWPEHPHTATCTPLPFVVQC